MGDSSTEDKDRDFIQLIKQNIGFTGHAHLEKVKIAIETPPDTLTFPKESIAYIHFKQPPEQPTDYVQLKLGGSASGEIVEPDEIEFTIAASGDTKKWSREHVLVLKFDITEDESEKQAE